MKLQRLMKLATGHLLPGPVKLAGLLAMHATGRRNIGIFIDPAMGCNLSCMMCYFSVPEKRRQMKGLITPERIDQVQRALFHRALKLQIGCGAEPTLYPALADLVRRGKEAGIPWVSLTSNGQLLARNTPSLESLAAAGLDELTLSLHGTDAETYEHLMPGARFELFRKLATDIAEVKKKYPHFTLRVNFTVNSLNYRNLMGDAFWQLWAPGGEPDVVQMRPVQNMGETAWKDFDLSAIRENYDESIAAVARECRRRGITCIYPSLRNLDEVNDTQDAVSAVIENLTYCYVSTTDCYAPDFDLATDTYESYHRRRATTRHLLRSIFRPGTSRTRNASKKLNYTVK